MKIALTTAVLLALLGPSGIGEAGQAQENPPAREKPSAEAVPAQCARGTDAA